MMAHGAGKALWGPSGGNMLDKWQVIYILIRISPLPTYSFKMFNFKV